MNRKYTACIFERGILDAFEGLASYNSWMQDADVASHRNAEVV